jgi:Co/Zn/Cd efflux system component
MSGLLNKFVPNHDRITGKPINIWLKYIDPSLTLLIVIVIAIKAIPVIWSLGQILVEAVPAGINTHQLIRTIMKTIPKIRAVHSVHVWRLIERIESNNDQSQTFSFLFFLF